MPEKRDAVERWYIDNPNEWERVAHDLGAHVMDVAYSVGSATLSPEFKVHAMARLWAHLADRMPALDAVRITRQRGICG